MSHHKIAAFNFWKGHPSTDLLPNKQIIEASQKILTTFDKTMAHYDGLNDTHPLNYGPDLGNLEVRREIATWNDKNFNISTSNPDCINLTNGASYGLMNLLLQTTSPANGLTKRVFLVSPTYFLINAVFADAGFSGKLSAIEEFPNGQINLDKLEHELEKIESESPSQREIQPKDIPNTYDPTRPMKKIYNYMMYLVPTFSNPQGGSLNDASKLRLINIARKYNMLLVCDDVYDLLDFNSVGKDHYKYQKRLVYFDRETLPEGEKFGNTVSNATFSKLLGPGLRVGWQETATSELANLIASGGANMSGGTPGQLNTVIIGELLKTGQVNQIIKKLNIVYSERANILKRAMAKYMPTGTKVSGLEGGYFSWVTLPDGYDNEKIIAKCSELGVHLAPGKNFEVVGEELNWGKNGVRLSISYLQADKIDEGIKIWGDVCKQFK
ncbi:2-aminoadipate transaminase [Martiniozyma asiatica (nom. inval.)]|nr:2-aminoadipate transaminase [Martiniozyma asiatica]